VKVTSMDLNHTVELMLHVNYHFTIEAWRCLILNYLLFYTKAIVSSKIKYKKNKKLINFEGR